jgi:hypothetical protein
MCYLWLSSTEIMSSAMIGHSNKTVPHYILTLQYSSGMRTVYLLSLITIISLWIVRTWILWTILFGMNLCTRWTETKSNQIRPWLTSCNKRQRKFERQLSLKAAAVGCYDVWSHASSFMLLYHFRAPRNVPMDIRLDIPLFHLDLSLDLTPDTHHLDSDIISPDVASGAWINHPL